MCIRDRNDIYEGVFANNNEFWVSNRKDIEVIDIKTYKVITTYNAINGLPSSYIKALKCDSKGRIWVATPAGIGLFDPVSASWHIFNRFDGLAQDFLENGLFITSDDRILISQKHGVAFYPIDSIYVRVKPIHLRITSLLVNNKPFTDSVLPEYINSLKLKHDQNNITLEFAAMDWQYPFKTSYYYRIDGLKGFDEWTVVEDARLDLAGLSPGKYQVNIKALGSGAVWSNEVQLPIEIKPAFWQTAWFQLLVMGSFLSAFYFFFRYQLHQIKKVVTMRDQISRDLHDDIGASLSNIAILNEMAKRNVSENTLKANEYLDRSAEDITNISKNLRDIVWSIDPEQDFIHTLFSRMRSFATEILDGKDIACFVHLPEYPQNIKLDIRAKREFYLIFKEAINNIIKHSQATEARIDLMHHLGTLHLSIQDNGKGFDLTEISNGNGINNMYNRAKSLGAQLNIETQPGKGTRVSMQMKV